MIEKWGNLRGLCKFIIPNDCLPQKIEMELREDGINYDIKIHTTISNNGEITNAVIKSIAGLPGDIELKMQYENEKDKSKAELFSITVPENERG